MLTLHSVHPFLSSFEQRKLGVAIAHGLFLPVCLFSFSYRHHYADCHTRTYRVEDEHQEEARDVHVRRGNRGSPLSPKTKLQRHRPTDPSFAFSLSLDYCVCEYLLCGSVRRCSPTTSPRPSMETCWSTSTTSPSGRRTRPSSRRGTIEEVEEAEEEEGAEEEEEAEGAEGVEGAGAVLSGG